MRSARFLTLWCILLAPIAVEAEEGLKSDHTSFTFRLVAGENFVSLPIHPERSALGAVFPVASLPAGKDPSEATVLYTFGVATTAQPRAVHYWLSDQGHWMSVSVTPTTS